MKKFSHLDENGNVKMVDISDKPITERTAISSAKIKISKETIELINDDKIPKGNVFSIAKIAGIQAAKKTSDLIPLCHQLNISWIDISFEIQNHNIFVKSFAKTKEATGIEMEVLTATSVACLTIYDMCKSIDKDIEISEIKLDKKTGGKNLFEYYNPKTAILTLSDTRNKKTDLSGQILNEGLEKNGCNIKYYKLIPDDRKKLELEVENLLKKDFDLIVTTGGTGVGPRDITIETISPMLSQRLNGVEQALHNFGRKKTSTAMLSRLIVGRIRNTFIICLPGSSSAINDALNVLMPHFLHVYPMSKGKKH